MQKNIFYVALLLLLTFVVGCSDSDKNGTDPNMLVLDVSTEEIALDRSKASETAVTFSWNKGVDRGSEYEIVYYFRLDVFGTDYKESSTEPIEIPADGERSVSYTHEELYKLLEPKWGISPGNEVTLQGRIVAKANGVIFVYPEISFATVTVGNYKPEPLFMMGSATLAGDDATKGIRITESDVGVIYHWQGGLKQGGFKFITTLGEELPSLNKGANNTTLVNRTKADEADTLFPVDEDGTYSIAIFRDKMEILYAAMPYPSLYLIGSGTSAEWNIDKAMEMTHNPLQPNEFYIIVELKEGEVKFYSERNWDSTFFKPLKPEASLQDDPEVNAEINGDDWKWKVREGEAGTYRISLNTVDLRVKFEKLD